MRYFVPRLYYIRCNNRYAKKTYRMRSAERKKLEFRSQKSEYGDRTRAFSFFLLRFFAIESIIKYLKTIAKGSA